MEYIIYNNILESKHQYTSRVYLFHARKVDTSYSMDGACWKILK